jgi:hypothetical protein
MMGSMAHKAKTMLLLAALAGLAACSGPHYTDSDPPPPHWAPVPDMLGLPR